MRLQDRRKTKSTIPGIYPVRLQQTAFAILKLKRRRMADDTIYSSMPFMHHDVADEDFGSTSLLVVPEKESKREEISFWLWWILLFQPSFDRYRYIQRFKLMLPMF